MTTHVTSAPSADPGASTHPNLDALVEAIGFTQAQVASTCADGHDMTPPPRLLAAIAAVRAEIDALRARAGDAEAKVAELSTPDIIGDDDDVYYAEMDFDSAVEYPATIREVWANRTLGTWFAARIETAWDEESDVDEQRIELYPTRKEGEDAVAASATAKRAYLATLTTDDALPFGDVLVDERPEHT